MEKVEKIVKNTKELTSFWDSFQEQYTKNFELNMSPFYFNLLNLANVFNAKKDEQILELSIGSGFGFFNLIHNTQAKLYGGDISEKMIASAQERLSKIDLKALPNKPEIMYLDNENLSQFKNNTFRTVISNFSLHLVSDPFKMLTETRRVLDSNNKASKAVFSIWGRPENNILFTILVRAMKELKLEIPEVRSNFHISKKDDCFDLCKKAGFQDIALEYTNILLNFENTNDMEFYFELPSTVELLSKVDSEKKEQVKSIVRKNFDLEFKKNKRLSLEALIICLN